MPASFATDLITKRELDGDETGKTESEMKMFPSPLRLGGREMGLRHDPGKDPLVLGFPGIKLSLFGPFLEGEEGVRGKALTGVLKVVLKRSPF